MLSRGHVLLQGCHIQSEPLCDGHSQANIGAEEMA